MGESGDKGPKTIMNFIIVFSNHNVSSFLGINDFCIIEFIFENF